MGRSSNWLGAVLILSVAFSSAGIAQTEIANRSFEDGADPGDATVLHPGSSAIDGWTVVGGDIWYVAGKWKHSQGVRSVGLLCGGGISQTLTTDPNQQYELRFNMAGDPSTGPPVKSVAVSFGAENRVFTFDSTGRSTTDMGWEPRFWIFTARDTKTTLTFLSPKSECSTPAVDSLRITAVEIGVQIHPDVMRPSGGAELAPRVGRSNGIWSAGSH